MNDKFDSDELFSEETLSQLNKLNSILEIAQFLYSLQQNAEPKSIMDLLINKPQESDFRKRLRTLLPDTQPTIKSWDKLTRKQNPAFYDSLQKVSIRHRQAVNMAPILIHQRRMRK